MPKKLKRLKRPKRLKSRVLKSPLGDLGATNLKRRKGGRAERQKGLGNDFLMSIMINCV